MPSVVIVDDSPTARLALRRALEASDDVRVVAEAATGREALRLVRHLRPDLVTMDVYLRRENGIEVTARIMATTPCPILIVTGIRPDDPELVFMAMQAGALDVRAKLPSPQSPAYEEERRRLVRLVRALSAVPVVTHRRRPRPAAPADDVRPGAEGRELETSGDRILLIGASTGGPPVIHEVLRSLPAPCSFPIAIAQHISAGFTGPLAKWLQETTGHRVVICDREHKAAPGEVYMAPDDRHLAFLAGGRLGPSAKPPRGHQRPSVDELFESAARYFGKRAIGVLLTGMGRDGSEGLATLRRAGALTIAQRPESCVAPGMPASAIEKRAAARVLSPEEIGREIRRSLAVGSQAVAREDL